MELNTCLHGTRRGTYCVECHELEINLASCFKLPIPPESPLVRAQFEALIQLTRTKKVQVGDQAWYLLADWTVTRAGPEGGQQMDVVEAAKQVGKALHWERAFSRVAAAIASVESPLAGAEE